MPLFDTHAHYDDAKFEDKSDEILTGLFSGEVSYIINQSINLETCEKSLKLAEKYPNMYAACGIHPENCGEYAEDGLPEVIARVEEYLKHPKAVAIGEIGLDNHWTENSRELQEKWFVAQLELAEKTGYPVVIHDREAHGRTMEIIKAFPKVIGVMHSFSGSAEMARELVRLGWYISFSGVLTFKNAVKTVEAAEKVPKELLLIETDCPYLAPHPHRGELNHSGYMRFTAERLAEIKNSDYEEICRITEDNAKRLFGIKDGGNRKIL